MLIVLTGESGSGKSYIQKYMHTRFNVKPITTYTTRDMRENEVDGIDYHFVSLDEFSRMCNNNEFLEIAEYSGNRWYGSSKKDVVSAIEYNETWHSIVLTPPGLRKVKELSEFDFLSRNVFFVHVEARLDIRTIRYIERCGSNFGFNDFAEIYERVQRDFGMFLNIDDECNYTVFNNGDHTIHQIAKSIILSAKDYKEGNLEWMISSGRIKGTPVRKGPKLNKEDNK